MGSYKIEELMQKQQKHKVRFNELDAFADNTLRDYQIANKLKVYNAWQTHKSVMLQMPTGTGKTRLFVSIVKDLHNWGAKNKIAVKVLILAHRKELIEQIDYNVGIKYGLAHGMILSQSIEQRLYPVQIGMVPTMHRRIDRWSDKNFDIIIIDEAHHVKARTYKKIINEYPNAKILGVTATPYRLNGVGFRPEFDELVTSAPVYEFIQKGYLSDYHYYSISSRSRLQESINNMDIDIDGDYTETAMMNVMDTDEIRANIVKTYLQFAKGKKGIVFTINKSHNLHVKERFENEGIVTAAIDSDTSKQEREAIVSKFKKGEIEILCNVNIFSEGFDCPDIEFIQLARPTCSLAMYLQQVGRGLRPTEGKERVIFLDNVGLYNKFGFPSARRNWRYHFEGHENEKEDFLLNITSDLDEANRTVTTIEEGDESVQLLYDSQSNNSSEAVEYGELSDDIAEITAAINIIKNIGMEVPQDYLAKLEDMKQQSDPEYIIKREINAIINKYNIESVFSFNFRTIDKPSLEVEIQKNLILRDKSKKQKEEINTLIRVAEKMKLSVLPQLPEKIVDCDNTIEQCNQIQQCLEELQQMFQSYSHKNEIRVTYSADNFIVKCRPVAIDNSNKYDKKQRTGEMGSRAPRFRFSMANIPVGAELVFTPLNLKVVVANDNCIAYQNKLYKLSQFCVEFMPHDMRNSSDAYQGVRYFTYNGELLLDLRRRMRV